VRDYDYPRPRFRPRRTRFLIEAAQARNEDARITTSVGMMRPDELPAATLSLVHSVTALTNVSEAAREQL
jgi:acetoin utilization deacetylase AcuC-like enzyme